MMENLPESLSELSSEFKASLVQSLVQDSIPEIFFKWTKFSARYCTVPLVKCRHLWISTVENPSLVKHETWNSSNLGTESGFKICRIRSSVHLGRSLLPMLVTLKFLRLLDFDKKCDRFVKLILESRRFFKLTKGTVLPYRKGTLAASMLKMSLVGFSMWRLSRLGQGYTNRGKWK